MVHEQHQLVEEGEAHRNVVRHHMEPEQRASLRILESPQECDPVRQEAKHLREQLSEGRPGCAALQGRS